MMMILVLTDEQVNLGESAVPVKTGGRERPANDFYHPEKVTTDMCRCRCGAA
ncbi:hypothetical protein [Oceanisphaera sediminis]|uniref:hypothetical protein n=1 Tax=Oceanisphaera sediminis TaxID=981381 RepID=UPI0031EA9C71